MEGKHPKYAQRKAKSISKVREKILFNIFAETIMPVTLFTPPPPPPPPKFLQNHCLGFLPRRLLHPEEIGNNGYAIFFFLGGGGRRVNKVRYGLCERKHGRLFTWLQTKNTSFSSLSFRLERELQMFITMLQTVFSHVTSFYAK